MIDTEAVKLKIARWLDDRFMREPEFFLVDVKVQGRKITVYLDGDRGITVDKCGEYSRYLESHLDEAMLAGVNYILEVSSPGMDNPLKVQRQYKNAVGKEVSVIKFDGIRIDGVLKEADKNKLTLETAITAKGKAVETRMHEIPFSEIKSTKLKINI